MARKSSKPRTPLTRERVLLAAVELADAKGLQALSMRRIGQQLGVEAMSLYNHVANKDAILDGVVDLIVAKIALPTLDMPWREAMALRAWSAREVLLRHPWMAALLESRISGSMGEARLRYADTILGVLMKNGFTVEQAYQSFITLDSFIYGFVMQEVHWDQASDDRKANVAEIPWEDYPHMAQAMASLQAMMEDIPDGAAGYAPQFEFGLELVLDGIAMRVAG